MRWTTRPWTSGGDREEDERVTPVEREQVPAARRLARGGAWRCLPALLLMAAVAGGSGVPGAASNAPSPHAPVLDALGRNAPSLDGPGLAPETLELLRELGRLGPEDLRFPQRAPKPHVTKLRDLPAAGGTTVPGGRLVFVRAVWGDLAGLGGTAPQTWPGYLAATRGEAIPLAAIGLEPDDLVLPPLAANVVQWVSQTGPASDGILAALELPPPPPGLPVTDFLSFFTPQVSLSWPAQASNGVDLLQPADPSGNQVSVVALEPRPGRIAGFAEGVWNAGPTPGQPAGVLAGMWTDPGGNPLGFLQGVWMPSPGGPPGGSLAAVIVDGGGSLVAILQGQYGVQPPPFPGGPLRGLWFDPASGAPIATFQGNFVPSPGPQGGFFQLAWLDPGP